MNSYKKNIAFSTILSISSIIFPIITFPYISRVLHPDGYGKVSFALSVVQYFIMFCMLGIPSYGIRECAKVRDNKEKLTLLVSELLSINIVLLMITMFIYLVTISTIPVLKEDWLLFLIMGSSVVLNLFGVEWLYKALEAYDYITIRTVVFKFIGLILMFLLVHKQDDYVKYGVITVIATYGSYILNIINISKYVDVKNFHFHLNREHFKPIIVFFGAAIAISIYTHLDTVMIGIMKDSTEVGYYTAASKVKSVVASVLSAPAAVFLPSMSKMLNEGKKQEFRRISSINLNIMVLLSIPVTIIVTFLSPEIIIVLSGTEYIKSISMMMIITPTVFFIAMTGIIGTQMLNPMGYESVILKSVSYAAIVDFALNIFFIYLFGGNGAALSTLIAEIIVFIVQISGLRKIKCDLMNYRYILKVLMVSAISIGITMIVACRLSASPIGYLLLKTVLFFCVFVTIMFFVKDETFMLCIGNLKDSRNREK